jgi:Zn-dependent peptidase ImmA (M78 family)
MKLPIPGYIQDIRSNCESIDDAIAIILKECKITKPPINVIQIATNMGFSVYDAEFKDNKIVGVIADMHEPIKPFGKKRIIATKRGDYPTRKLFTIAHEIGHFVMHCGEANDYFERDIDEDELFDTRDDTECAADKFAACLLMPEDMFIDYVRKSPYYLLDKEALIQDIQKMFVVSYTAAKLRLNEVDLNWQ